MAIKRTVDAPTSPTWTQADEESLLTGMLWHYTPSGTERPLSEWLCAHLGTSALRLAVDAVGNFIAELPATVATPEPPCVLLGHLDTVPGYIRVRREDGRLYGRGAVDAKGPLAAFIAATRRLAASGTPRCRPVIVVGAVEEEAATSRGTRAVLERWQPAYTIIGEPSSASAVTLGYKGRLLVSYRVERPVAHTARPEESVCARAVAFWQTVQQAADDWNAAHVAPLSQSSFFAALMPSLRSINSGSDGFSDWCELQIGYRLPPDYDTNALESWLAQEAQADGAQITCRAAEVAYQGPRRGPLVSAFVRAMRAEGITPAFKLKTGTSDMNVVAPVWQCPILAYGPGDSALDHTPNEHIDLAEYHQAISVLERALAELVSAPAREEARA
ncbi:MAG TPA: [LysW]-lysine hydrolase [Ktedonobacterales bacterium]|nr:[LysW]-lysine hydrolase [Ktedonobacterales bacterium]